MFHNYMFRTFPLAADIRLKSHRHSDST